MGRPAGEVGARGRAGGGGEARQVLQPLQPQDVADEGEEQQKLAHPRGRQVRPIREFNFFFGCKVRDHFCTRFEC